MSHDPAMAERLFRAIEAERAALLRVWQLGGLPSARQNLDGARAAVDAIVKEAAAR